MGVEESFGYGRWERTSERSGEIEEKSSGVEFRFLIEGTGTQRDLRVGPPEMRYFPTTHFRPDGRRDTGFLVRKIGEDFGLPETKI